MSRTGGSGHTFPYTSWKARKKLALRRAGRLAKSEARGLSRYERQGRREAAGGKGRAAVSLPEFLGGLTERGHEPGVGVIERLAGRLGGRVDARRRRACDRGWPMLRVLRRGGRSLALGRW